MLDEWRQVDAKNLPFWSRRTPPAQGVESPQSTIPGVPKIVVAHILSAPDTVDDYSRVLPAADMIESHETWAHRSFGLGVYTDRRAPPLTRPVPYLIALPASSIPFSPTTSFGSL